MPSTAFEPQRIPTTAEDMHRIDVWGSDIANQKVYLCSGTYVMASTAHTTWLVCKRHFSSSHTKPILKPLRESSNMSIHKSRQSVSIARRSSEPSCRTKSNSSTKTSSSPVPSCAQHSYQNAQNRPKRSYFHRKTLFWSVSVAKLRFQSLNFCGKMRVIGLRGEVKCAHVFSLQNEVMSTEGLVLRSISVAYLSSVK
jgi:hypothetical protein